MAYRGSSAKDGERWKQARVPDISGYLAPRPLSYENYGKASIARSRQPQAAYEVESR